MFCQRSGLESAEPTAMLVEVSTETREKAKLCGVISKVAGLSGRLSSVVQIRTALSEPDYTEEDCQTVSSSLSSAGAGSTDRRAH